jgi:hypothetical protein
VAAHLEAGCPRCEADLAELLAFAAAEQDAGLAAARDPSVGPGEGGLRRLLATRLVPLGGRGGPSRGLRGTPGANRDAPTILLQTDEAIVVLRVKREARRDTVSVSGLVLPHRSDSALLRGAEAHLLALAAPGVASGGASVERVDERGGFVLEDVAPGAYRLELRSARGALVIDDFEIGRG